MGAFVLITDGVIEGPSFPIEKGLEAVMHRAGAHAGADADVLADEIIKAAALTGHQDDAAVLVLCHDSGPGRTA